MIEERTMTEELEAVRDAYVREVCERYDELIALGEVDRLTELAYIAHDVLPFGQELAALFAANYSLLDNSDLLTLAFNLEDWGLDPRDCTTIAAIRYTLTRFLVSEVGGDQLSPSPRDHLAPIYWSPGADPHDISIADYPITGAEPEECTAGLAENSTIHSLNGLVLYLPA